MTVSVNQFPWGLLNVFSGMNAGVRKGELSKHLLQRLPMKKLAPKPRAEFRYITMAGRAHQLLLRESLTSLHRSWSALPAITVISDGSWCEPEIHAALQGWPDEIQVLMPEIIFQNIPATETPFLRQYAQSSPFGLKLGALHILSRKEPSLFVDVDILWYADPRPLLDPPAEWPRVRASRESCCFHAETLARQYCPKLLAPPYVNAGLLALNGPLMSNEQLEAMVESSLHNPHAGQYEQTILATAALQSGGLLPDQISYMDYADAEHSTPFAAASAGYCSRHYVHWIRHHFYTDALRLRLNFFLRRS
jgi:hypothetical protein